MSKTQAQEIKKHIEGSRYFSQICNQNPYIVIKTQCGTGRYYFKNISYRNDELILEFKLLQDKNYRDTKNIAYNIGEMCFLTASQYLYALDSQAYA